MDVRQLRYFVQIVESGSFTKAARLLLVAQPALSQQVSRLEAEVGKSLLVRSTRGVVPTQNGAALYHHAKFLLRQLDEAVIVARQDTSEVTGRVSIGMAPSTVCALGLPLLRHLREKYPGVVLNIVAGLASHMEGMARQGQLDVAILFSSAAETGLGSEPLLEEDVVVIVPANSALVPRHKKSLTIAEAATLPLVLPSPSPRHHHRHRLTLEFERAHVTAHIVAEVDSLFLTMQYVAEGGVATIHSMAATLAFNAPEQFRCLPISDAQLVRTDYLYALPAQKLSAGASVVRAEVKQVVRRLAESGAWRGVRLLGPRADVADAVRPS